MGYFCPFTPLTTPKNQNLNKIKKTHGDITMLHRWTKIHDHMLYGSWDVWCMTDGIIIFHFRLLFALFRPNSPKKEKFKNMKATATTTTTKTWRYHHHKCTKNHYQMLYCSWDIWCVTDVIIFHFGLFFALLQP